jgi:hypothetical protein
MRFVAAIFCAFLICTAPIPGQADADDPYSITFVQNNFKSAMALPGGKFGSAVKDFQRLGDGVSIAILKILEEQDMKNPKSVEACLSLIRDSFSYPPIISINVNKKPKVTMFLLNYLRQSALDPQIQRDIQQTIEYVQHQASSPEQR